MPLSPVMNRNGHFDGRDSLRLWLQLLTLTTMVEKKIRRRLTEEFETTLPRFDVMATLERAHGKLTMGELSKKLLVSKGNVTWVVTSLVKQGLIRREKDEADKRIHFLSLTDKGRREFEAQAKAHKEWINEIFSGLSEQERALMTENLSKLKTMTQFNHEGEEV